MSMTLKARHLDAEVKKKCWQNDATRDTEKQTLNTNELRKKLILISGWKSMKHREKIPII